LIESIRFWRIPGKEDVAQPKKGNNSSSKSKILPMITHEGGG
jgi:hypothetical protein